MNKIKILPPSLIAKIAAGEVIERPAYAVKELIDNAIDANADVIKIDIEKSGLKKIAVSDNGDGMSKEDIILCFKPHTTSKIFSESDLNNIKSMGFRGEALSSIVSISKTTIKSRPKDTINGTLIEVYEENILQNKPIGMSVGTAIIIEDLFKNVPARIKFLRNPTIEFKYITDMVISHALAYLNIHFILKHNNKVIFDLPQTTSLETRIEKLLSQSFSNNIIPIQHNSSHIKIHGYISRPPTSTRSISKQYIFVNNRRVHDKLLSSTVKSAYGTLLEKDLHPYLILFIEIPYELVDVNVHPRKDQVSFHNAESLYKTIYELITDTLSSTKNMDKRWHGYINSEDKNNSSLTNSYAGNLLKDQMRAWNILSLENIQKSARIIQMHNLYIFVQTQKGVMIFDQHAIHERILYEKFKKSFIKLKEENKQHVLNKTHIIDLSINEALILNKNTTLFSSLGFDIEHFSGNSFRITAIPLLFKDRDISFLIHEIIDDLNDEKEIKDIDHATHKMLAYLACRTAVKAGDSLTVDQCEKLIEELSVTENNLTCPHGRPTYIEMNINDFHKQFKR